MFIIGHRGAAGLAPENTLDGIAVAKAHGVDAVEIDIRATSDGHLVLQHDPTLLRHADDATKISDLTLKQVQTTITKSGHPIPTLEEAFEEAGKTQLVVEGKADGWAEPLAELLKKHKGPKPMVISDSHRELVYFSTLSPRTETYAISWTHPYDSLYLARQAHLTGVSLHFAHYNPITYHFCKRAGLKMIMSPINRRWLAKLLHRFYPQVMITTDYPDRFIERHRIRKALVARKKKKKSKAGRREK